MKRHMKRIAAPASWPIERKDATFVTRPQTSHRIGLCMPLSMIVRDLLKYAKTAREVRKVLNSEEVLVDGRRVKYSKFGVGLMDVLEIPKTKESFTVVLNNKGKLSLVKPLNPKVKLCMIIGKRVVKGGKVQINLHDGKNILTENKVGVGDTVILGLPEQSISEHLTLEKGNLVYLTGGKHIGELGQIEEVKPGAIKVKIGDDIFETARRLAFVVGKQKPLINLEK